MAEICFGTDTSCARTCLESEVLPRGRMGSSRPGAKAEHSAGLGHCMGSFRVAAVPRCSIIILSQRQAVVFDPIQEAMDAAAPGAGTSLIAAAHTSKGSEEAQVSIAEG